RGSGVLALITEDDHALAEKTIRLLPRQIPVARLDSPYHGPFACLNLLTKALYVVGAAGRARGIAPGNPGGPAWGRRIYHLSWFNPKKGRPTRPGQSLPVAEAIAIERKSGSTIATLARGAQLQFWREGYQSFTKIITTAFFQAVILDYDGTLCDDKDRFKG